jgi:hypothetical protein
VAHIEKRQHERVAIACQPTGALALRMDERLVPVAMIKDVSSYGVNVVVGDQVPERTRITVSYADENLLLDVYGIVAWCAPAMPGRSSMVEPGSFVLGIELFSPTLLTAVLSAAHQGPEPFLAE